jgi:hypothetical protein
MHPPCVDEWTIKASLFNDMHNILWHKLCSIEDITSMKAANMESRQALETLLTGHLQSRGLSRVHGQLAFMHKGQAVSLIADATIYRGSFITVLERGYKVREFRSGAGAFDWNAIVAVIVDVAENRLMAAQSKDIRADEIGAGRRLPGADLWSMLGSGLSSQFSIEPSQDKPGRVRVKLRDLDLDPIAALQLYAAVSRALAPSN